MPNKNQITFTVMKLGARNALEEARQSAGDRRTLDRLEQGRKVPQGVRTPADAALPEYLRARVECGTHCDVCQVVLLQGCAPPVRLSVVDVECGTYACYDGGRAEEGSSNGRQSDREKDSESVDMPTIEVEGYVD